MEHACYQNGRRTEVTANCTFTDLINYLLYFANNFLKRFCGLKVSKSVQRFALLLCFVSTLPCNAAEPAAGSCQIIRDPLLLPARIEAGSCLQLAGAGTLPAALELHGRLIIARGSKLQFSGGNLMLHPGSQLTVRGELALRGSTMKLKGSSILENQGRLLLENQSALTLHQDSQLKNIAELIVNKSQIAGAGRIDNAARLTLMDANLQGVDILFEHSGTLSLEGASTLLLDASSMLHSSGRIEAGINSSLQLAGSSRMENQRQLNIAGNLALRDQAILINRQQLTLEANALGYAGERAWLKNLHLMRLRGQLVFDEYSHFENSGTLQGENNSLLRLEGQALFKNAGTFRARGSVTRSTQAQIENIKPWVK